MSGGEKKISFSFSKVKKPSLTPKVNNDAKEKIEYVDCFDGAKGKFSYKGSIRNEDEEKKELVIPLITTRQSNDIKHKIEKKFGLIKNDDNNESQKNTAGVVKESNGEVTSKAPISIDEIAAAEILREVGQKTQENSNNLVISHNGDTDPSPENIDYDQVPVGAFGMAMLRGMGWKPDSGIGKEPRLVAPVSPKVRPKGLGLGAKPKAESNDDEKKDS
ncbi:hypothetical protein RUM44_008666 [Polyplax serrata]|uniref:G-patch domain-containing protein n=1 Tax=Polyplax serrata TaxID=468196 RepID=A0ABR1BD49_POLSC